MYQAKKLNADLEVIIRGHTELMDVLQYLFEVEPQAYVSAGVIRNSVWAKLHGQLWPLVHTEIDIIFHDPEDLNQAHAQYLSRQLSQKFPKIEWDVTNQAFVHEWYRLESGECIEPLHSIMEALSLWPETATAIAVRLLENGDFDVIAPFGLTDLLGLQLRWNKTLVSSEVFMQRVSAKRFLERWPDLNLIDV
ncbi:nucleotidyltransferase family protein [Acinetobacter sp. ANC 4648]|uniref:nucleotidyltransferase family protein n=1 Tax=Acinetobacter sp. ANC 4648 TaxID=1977875 RepID=UPI000A32DE3D|nr:nucleotidyltransferase family protein [Acinetobacter sp. ANC 4648]OTG79615.1 hypothetical protein B9T27_14425 [Acinetobacter sp. ANC 4648]